MHNVYKLVSSVMGEKVPAHEDASTGCIRVLLIHECTMIKRKVEKTFFSYHRTPNHPALWCFKYPKPQ